MFQELLSFWRDDSGLKHIFKHFDEMLEIAHEMFKLAKGCIFDGGSCSTIGSSIVKMDGQLNILQQIIRRDVITHLSVHGNADIVPCLAMMSIVKDAERLGDYVKNLFEVEEKGEDFKSDDKFNELKELADKVDIWFKQTQEAFDNVDEVLARKVREEGYMYEKKCDRIVWELMQDEGGKNRVGIALAFRFFKRVVAHLANICTSVVMPLDKIDYYKPSS